MVRRLQVVRLRYIFAQAPCQQRVLADDTPGFFIPAMSLVWLGLGFFRYFANRENSQKYQRIFILACSDGVAGGGEQPIAKFLREWEEYLVSRLNSLIHWLTVLGASPRRKAAAAALSAFCLLCALWWPSHLWYREGLLTKQRSIVSYELDPIDNALIAQNQRFNMLRALGSFVEMHQGSPGFAADFHRFARTLAEGAVGFRLLTLAPGGVQRLVHPPAGNEGVIGHDLLRDDRPEVKDSVRRAMQSRGIAISDPHEQRLGGLVIAGRFAIYLDGKFWGLANLVIDLPSHLAAAGIAEVKHLKLALRDSRQQVFFGDAATFAAAPVIHRIPLPEGRWEMAAVPRSGWSAAIEENLRLFDAGAFSAVILLSVLAYLIAFRDARLESAVESRTRELNAELAYRKLADQQLRAAEERYRTLVHLNPDAVVVNFNGKIVYANDATARLLGAHKPEDLLGRSPFDFVLPDARAELEQLYQQAKETGDPGPPSYQQRRRLDGSIVDVEVVAALLPWEGGTAVQAILRDVSERNRLHSQLVESERLASIGAAAAKIGHELANPINGMSLTIQLLEQRLSRELAQADAPIHLTVGRLKEEIARLGRLVSQFRTISRKEQYDFRPTKIAELIERVIEDEAPVLARQGIEVGFSIPPNLSLLSVDRDKIKQALLNLVINAVEAMPQGGKLVIAAAASERSVVVTVTDSGEGIPLGVNAFEPFLTTKKEGTGIGLFVVRQIITAHGGAVSYESIPGEGTTFRFEIPLNS